MRGLILSTLFTLSSFFVSAQNITVKGVVKDAKTGEPLPGVNIAVKNTSKGDITDLDGNYTIANVPRGAVLVFSYLGYVTKEVTVDSTTINVSLEESAEKLDEIVVIGYGTQRKKEVTGAVSVVSSETIEDLKPVRIEQALQGQVAGVNITSASGAPGAASNIRIRGISTNGNNNPLILVDGNPIEDLSVLNPADIASISVLKDATAGIYGVRGANGVILITTKSGRKNTDYKIIFNSYIGFQQTTREIPLLNATEYALLANEAYAANGQALPFTDVTSLGQGTDWQKEVFKTAPISSADVTINKGTKKSTYSLGVSFLTQDGIVGETKANFNRRNVKFNFSTDILDNLKFTSSSLYINTNSKGIIQNTIGSILYNALNMPPTTPVRNDTGEFSTPPPIGVGIEVANPLAQIDDAHNRVWVDKFSGSHALNYQFSDHLSAESRIQFNYATVQGNTFTPIINYGAGNVFNNERPSFNVFKTVFKDYTFDAFVKYERTFNDIHEIKVLLGTSVFRSQGINKRNITSLDVTGTDLNSSGLNGSIIDNLALSNQPREFFDSRLLSYFSRFQYSYDNKYLFSAVIRRDGSSNFAPRNKFGYFPSGSIGWIASNEDFLKGSNTINFLKLRASYGIIGNDRIPSFRFVSLVSGEGVYVFNDQITFGTALGAISNPEIKWEKNKPLDIGLDIGLFNKVDITLDYFNKKTEDLLVEPQVSGILGSTAPGSGLPTINAGTVENKGFEFSISYKDHIGEDFNFNMNYNFTTLENNVLFVGSDSGFLAGGSFGIGQDPPSRMEAGFPIGYFYGYRTNGIFQNQTEVDAHATQMNATPGDLRFVDVNGDGVINTDDRTYIGDPIPDITMGLNFSFDYKNFDFNMYAFASVGNEIVRNYERNQPLTNRTVYYLDRWRGQGTSTTFPRVTTGATGNTLFSDFYVEDGSFVRLQNIQVGYTLNEESTQKVGFDKVRFYLSSNNLFTLTKYRGYDPTTSNGAPIGGGIDQGFYPNPKTFLLGLNVNF
ncbi:MAG: SusC/RagA family TonB-linked outer membrane protein [Flavobacteriaceae bacterium]|nr:MAG: SusC/RagA family TonB-linked outer membrane protein [Flavobacteriaceae bacterium]